MEWLVTKRLPFTIAPHCRCIVCCTSYIKCYVLTKGILFTPSRSFRRNPISPIYLLKTTFMNIKTLLTHPEYTNVATGRPHTRRIHKTPNVANVFAAQEMCNEWRFCVNEKEWIKRVPWVCLCATKRNLSMDTWMEWIGLITVRCRSQTFVSAHCPPNICARTNTHTINARKIRWLLCDRRWRILWSRFRSWLFVLPLNSICQHDQRLCYRVGVFRCIARITADGSQTYCVRLNTVKTDLQMHPKRRTPKINFIWYGIRQHAWTLQTYGQPKKFAFTFPSSGRQSIRTGC